jgi:cell division protein FtsI/penicillin-binding protein 2
MAGAQATVSKPSTGAKTPPKSVQHHTAAHTTATTAHTATTHTATTHTAATHKAGAHSTTVHSRRRHRVYERFTASSFDSDAMELTAGDNIEGEDPQIREALIEALSNMNGTALAIDPSTGRILAMVNQKLALSHGAEPCSTIKLTVALAALEEGIIKRDTEVNLGGSYHMNLTEALAHSNNLYFETLGRSLGFERVRHYANEFGLGELAGYNIAGEQLGTYPDEELPASLGGVGRMCSFGESVSVTPLQLGALVAAIANGGTLYYLQHPQTPEDIATFKPRVKRMLNIAPLIPEIQDGMEANFNQFPVLGKTGTCSNNGTRYGWFASYANTPQGRIVTVFFLEGGRPTFGPKAAELTGEFYRALWDKNYFNGKPSVTPVEDPLAVPAPVVSESSGGN